MYVPLRVHGHHSLLTGVDAPRALCERARQLGLSALALTDVDTLAGLVDFLTAAEATGVRPIVGAEISDPGGAPGRLIALVTDERGIPNLCKLVSARHLGVDPGERGAEPTGPADFDLVQAAVRFRQGLLLLADHPRLLLGLSGRVSPRQLFAAVSPAALRRGTGPGRMRRPRSLNTHLDPDGGRREHGTASAAAEPAPDGELLAEPKVPPPARAAAAAELVEAARALGVATLAVPDVYHALPDGAREHRVRVAIKHNALGIDLPEEWVAEQPAHLLDPAELCALYADLPDAPGPFAKSLPDGVPGAVARTALVAETCRYVPALGQVHFPEIELAPEESAYSRLCTIAFEGARERYRPLRPEVVRRLDYELSAIDTLGFAPYFLLVQRIADFAREQGIPCVGRGSAADSLVSYCMKLTDADPLHYRLPFERFLNPARSDRPDIDLDFCWRRRDEVLEHVYDAFGPHRTAMICTLNTFGLRSAFREAALVEGIPPAEVNRWSRRLPYAPSNALTDEHIRAALREGGAARDDELADNLVARALAGTPECRDFPFGDERMRRALRSAASLIDAPRHFGLHPGGVVVSPGPITDFVACQRAAKGVVVTQLDKDAVEAIGLVKMDLLGNRALTVIDDCLRSLRGRGVEIDVEHLPEDDPETARVLREARTLGCFQVESPGMRNLLRQIGAATMDDVIQAVALIRPGPAGSGMKDAFVRRFRGLEPPRPPHPRLSELLWDTHGIMLYQEDVVQVASLLAGMDLTEADLLRRALQKCRERELESLCRRFLAGCEQNGVPAAEARGVWDLITNFASFAFCKAHAVTYGRIAYRTVYLKAHHPAAYLAAFLGSETGYYEQRVYVEEARRLGVPILPPDVNRSAASFSIEWVGRAGRAGPPSELRGEEARFPEEKLQPDSGDAGPSPPAGSGGGGTRVRSTAPDSRAVPCLRVGLGQVRGLSEATLEALLERRRGGGPFLSLPEFLERTGAHVDEAEHLVQAGAFDSFDHTRPELLWRLHLLTTPARRSPREERLDAAQIAACRATPSSRQRDAVRAAHARTGGWSRGGLGLGGAELEPGEAVELFPPPEVPALALPRLPELDARARGLLEFERLGLAVNVHPAALFPCQGEQRVAELLAQRRAGTLDAGRASLLGARGPVHPAACADVPRRAGARITLRGWLSASRRVRTSRGEWMRFLTLEDESGIAEAVLFPDVYRRDGHLLTDQGPHCVTGIVEDQMGACTLHAERIW